MLVRAWQVLPYCPTSFGDSPTNRPPPLPSIHTLLILRLKEDGLLEIKDYRDFYSGHNSNHVDYNYLFVNHQQVLNSLQNVGKEPHPRWKGSSKPIKAGWMIMPSLWLFKNTFAMLGGRIGHYK